VIDLGSFVPQAEITAENWLIAARAFGNCVGSIWITA
jgi:hypothetical protein